MRFSQIIVLLWLAVPLITWGGNNLLKRHRLPFWSLLLATGIIGYILLLTASRMSGLELKAVLDSYDLNGDGNYSGVELTPDREEAMRAYTSDTGRALAPFTAGPITLLWTLIVFGVCKLLGWCQRALFRMAESCPRE